MKRCPVCGKKVKNNAPHCPYCGTNLYANDTEQKVVLQPAAKIQRISFDFKQVFLIVLIAVISLGILGYKAINKDYGDEKNIISELMVENYSFRKKVEDIDERAHDVDEYIKTNFTVVKSSFSDQVTSNRKSVDYYGFYYLEENNEIYFDYTAENEKSCSLNIDYIAYVNDYSEFLDQIAKVDTLFADIGNVVLSEPISQVDIDDAYNAYYSKYTSNYAQEDANYVSINQCYSFVTFSEDNNGKYIEINLTYDPCEVIF